MYHKKCSLYFFFFLFLLLLQLPFQLKAQEQKAYFEEQPAPVQNEPAEQTDSTAKKAPVILEKLVEILEEKKAKKGTKDLLIDGLVIDETRTKMGRDFYDVFFSNWEMPKGAPNLSLVIRELPGRATSSFVSVEINEQEVVQMPLQPRYDIIEDMAKYAVAKCHEYVTNYEQIQRDLSSGDLSGSGIY